MSGTKLTKLTKLILLSPFGLGLLGAAMFYFQEHHVVRSVASIEPFTPHGLMLGKQAAAMTVEIVGPANYPENRTEIVELVGFITQHLSADSSLTYTWTLPEGVDLVRGPLSDTLTNLPLGKAQQVSILVRGFSRDIQKMISLQSTVLANNRPLSASAVVVSRPEDTRETRVMDLQAQARAAAEEAKEKAAESQNK